MHPGLQPNNHAMVFFRRVFELGEKPGSFVVHVSADNHYRLFVNGNYVTRGPARGDISHWFFEILNHIRASPPGNIELDLKMEGRKVSGEILIPYELSANFNWGDNRIV